MLAAILMERELEKLKEQIKSDDWDTCLSAVDRLAQIDSTESTNILLDMLKSGDSQIRNLAAVAMRESKNQKYFGPLIKRINELGPSGQIGTLVYALELLDCSHNLFDIANLNLNSGTNLEVKHSTTVILNEQDFLVTKDELKKVNELLDKFDFDIQGFDVKYKILD